jgi:hypothetical protein
MTENGRKISTAGRKMSVGCEAEKVSKHHCYYACILQEYQHEIYVGKLL